MEQEIELLVNGAKRRLVAQRGRKLLEVLREDLQLTGTKYGCGEGQCGACTVLIDGQPVRSCQAQARLVAGRDIRTIEDLAQGGKLHPVQQAFVEEGAMQCGYCTAGMIMSAVALLAQKLDPSREDIVQAMNGNICRCCAYPGYLAAIRRAVELGKERSTP